MTSLREKRVAITAYSLGGLASLWLYVAMWPSLQAQAATYNQLLKSLSPAILKAFGAYSVGLTDFEGLLATKQFGFTWPLLVLFLAVSLGGSYLAGEVDQTTIGLWLAAPVSRLKIFLAKFCAGVAALVVFTLASIPAVIPVAAAYNVHTHTHYIWSLTLVGGLFGLAVFGLSMLASSLFSKKSRVYAVMSSLLLIMFVLNLAAELNDKLTKLKYASFFYYYNSTDLLSGGKINHASLWVFLTVAVLSPVLAALIFSRRDIAI